MPKANPVHDLPLTSAQRELVAANIGLIFLVLKRLPLPAIAALGGIDDAGQEGVFGLVRAARKFKPVLGYKFSTYAYWCIRHHLVRQSATAGIIKLPPLNRTEERSPEWKAARDKATEVWSLSRRTDGYGRGYRTHGNQRGGGRSDENCGDQIDGFDVAAPIPDERDTDAEDAVRLALAKVEKTHSRYVRVLIGTIVEGINHCELGREMGISCERVRQLKVKAVKKLREVMGSV